MNNVTQSVAAPRAGTRAFWRDDATGRIAGGFRGGQQMIEALLEMSIKEFVKVNAMLGLQHWADARSARARRAASEEAPPRNVSPAVVLALKMPTGAQALQATVGCNGPAAPRLSTALGKATTSALANHALENSDITGFRASLLGAFVTALTEGLMQMAATICKDPDSHGDSTPLTQDLDLESDGNASGPPEIGRMVETWIEERNARGGEPQPPSVHVEREVGLRKPIRTPSTRERDAHSEQSPRSPAPMITRF